MFMFKPRGIAFLAAVAGFASFAQARPDLNAFIDKSVRTTPELVSHVRSNSEVRDRYMRHFAMTGSEVVSYLKTLHPATLQSDGIYRVYSVPVGGVLKAHTEKLKKGQKVFSTADGTPVGAGRRA